MSALMNQKGSVMYVCRNSSQNFLALRYDGAAVIVTGELLKLKDFQADDIIEFDANPIGKAEASLYNTVKPKWKATRIKFLKHAEQWKGTARVVTMDGNGEYCFLEGKDPKGVSYNIFCTRISVLPPVEKLSSIFSTGNTVKVICKEQVASVRNNQVKWRTVAATDMKHELRAGTPLNSYEAIPILPSVPKNAPKLRMPPAGPRPATAAAAVKSNSTSSIQQNSTSPGSQRESPVLIPPPISASSAVTIAQVLKDSIENETRNSNVSPIPIAPNSPIPIPAPILSPVPAPISPPTSTNQEVPFTPPGLDLSEPTLSNLPIPSYEWMKFDLIQTLDKKYLNPPINDIHEEHRKLREISHHLAGGNCNFCLSH